MLRAVSSDRVGYASALAVFFLIGISQSSIGPLLPLFEKRYAVSVPESSYLSAYFSGSPLAMLLISMSKISGRVLLPFCLGIYATGCGGIFPPWRGWQWDRSSPRGWSGSLRLAVIGA